VARAEALVGVRSVKARFERLALTETYLPPRAAVLTAQYTFLHIARHGILAETGTISETTLSRCPPTISLAP
jgi:hypothetical protein